ncbi:DUF411 domain-containing protein [Microbulbifer variabilis]|uniref:DUF411 domain-containing protein n=1 Tax=Microbulbifer variabilis TaxID=266805 RepID=UPI001CFE9D87|nr:DUF411 domain-containing protein [Microbulbifer variabilis]
MKKAILPLVFVASLAGFVAAEGTDDTAALIVYKHPLCFCCNKWITHLKENNLEATSVFKVNMQGVKRKWGIPRGLEGCHTAVWHDKYIFEGHVPALHIQKFLAAPPDGSVGLMVAGMPVGSPGMEMEDGEKFEPYNIYLLLKNGDYRLYARIEKPDET